MVEIRVDGLGEAVGWPPVGSHIVFRPLGAGAGAGAWRSRIVKRLEQGMIKVGAQNMPYDDKWYKVDEMEITVLGQGARLPSSRNIMQPTDNKQLMRNRESYNRLPLRAFLAMPVGLLAQLMAGCGLGNARTKEEKDGTGCSPDDRRESCSLRERARGQAQVNQAGGPQTQVDRAGGLQEEQPAGDRPCSTDDIAVCWERLQAQHRGEWQ